MDQKLVNFTDLSRTLRLASEGITISEFDTGKEMIDIKLYSKASPSDPFLTFERLTVPNARGEQIPLTQIAQVNPTFSIQNIPHRDLSRAVTISSDVKGRTATDVMAEIKPLIEKIPFP
jgi:multidrug efflux pump subunit AcrB